MVQLSFVIPCYRSEHTILQVLNEIEQKIRDNFNAAFEKSLGEEEVDEEQEKEPEE